MAECILWPEIPSEDPSGQDAEPWISCILYQGGKDRHDALKNHCEVTREQVLSDGDLKKRQGGGKNRWAKPRRKPWKFLPKRDAFGNAIGQWMGRCYPITKKKSTWSSHLLMFGFARVRSHKTSLKIWLKLLILPNNLPSPQPLKNHEKFCEISRAHEPPKVGFRTRVRIPWHKRLGSYHKNAFISSTLYKKAKIMYRDLSGQVPAVKLIWNQGLFSASRQHLREKKKQLGSCELGKNSSGISSK